MSISYTSDADPEPEVVCHNIVLVEPHLSRDVELTKMETILKDSYNIINTYYLPLYYPICNKTFCEY